MNLHLIHRYKTVRYEGYSKYRVCKVCGKRQFISYLPGFGPIDGYWLRTGEFNPLDEKPTPSANRVRL